MINSRIIKNKNSKSYYYIKKMNLKNNKNGESKINDKFRR